ncbi:MAG: leucine-rich repeat domain-containing protein [Chryseotalea sp.]
MGLRENISRIEKKITALNLLRKENGVEPYTLNDTVSNSEIKKFEHKHGITLPSEYKMFLRFLGNGNCENNYRHIRPLRETTRYHYLDDVELELAKSFPFDTKTGNRIIKESIYNSYPANDVHAIMQKSGSSTISGCLLLNYEGWGSSFTALVLNGTERGRIWHVADMYHPYYKASGTSFKTFSFLEWVEKMLDDQLLPSSKTLFTEGMYENITALNLEDEQQDWQNKTNIHALGYCVNVKELNLSRNYSLSFLPDSIGLLQKLTVFKFNGGNLKILPNSIANLKNLEILELSDQNIITLPSTIGKLQKLKKLSLYWNTSLTHLPVSFSKLTQLQNLSIAYCSALNLERTLPVLGKLPKLKTLRFHAKKIPPQINSLKYITSLALLRAYGKNKLTLHKNLSKLTQLKELYLNDAGLTALPAWIGQLTQLETLVVDDNPLTTLPSEIGKLKNLKHLSLKRTSIKKLPSSLQYLHKLETLKTDYTASINFTDICNTIKHCPKVSELYVQTTKQIPVEIGQLKNLQNLILELLHKKEYKIPSTIYGMKNLTLLRLATKGKIILPTEFSALKKLRILRIEASDLILPETFGQLNTLTELSITDCNIPKLPDNFSALRNLKKLTLLGNTFSNWHDACIKIAALPNLQELKLSVKFLPPEIGLCQTLKRLEIYNSIDFENHQQLTKLPKEIGKLKNLTHLDIDGNRVTEIPTSIGNLKKLKYLCVHDNRLTALPHTLGKLTTLQVLDISKNKITRLPKWIFALKNLKQLCVNENLFTLTTKELKQLKYIYELNA